MRLFLVVLAVLCLGVVVGHSSLSWRSGPATPVRYECDPAMDDIPPGC